MSLTTRSASLSQYAHTFREGSRRRRVFVWLSKAVQELDLLLSGLSGASREIHNARRERQSLPPASHSFDYEGRRG